MLSQRKAFNAKAEILSCPGRQELNDLYKAERNANLRFINALLHLFFRAIHHDLAYLIPPFTTRFLEYAPGVSG